MRVSRLFLFLISVTVIVSMFYSQDLELSAVVTFSVHFTFLTLRFAIVEEFLWSTSLVIVRYKIHRTIFVVAKMKRHEL